MKRTLKWLLPAVVAVEAALVWTGVLELRDAVLLVAGLEILLIFAVVGEVALVARGYRRGRREGLDFWMALEDELAAVMPRRLARVAVLEPRLWVCLVRWTFRRTRSGEGAFSYHKRSPMGMMLVMVLLVTPVELVFWELLTPWAWLRLLLLVLGIYALFWVFGFYASLVALPHRLEKGGLRLRYGAFAEGSIPYTDIAEIKTARRRAPKSGDGLQAASEEDALYMAINGKTDLTLRLGTPRTVRGFFRTPVPATKLHLAVDDPGRMAAELRRRLDEPAPSKPPALA